MRNVHGKPAKILLRKTQKDSVTACPRVGAVNLNKFPLRGVRWILSCRTLTTVASNLRAILAGLEMTA